MLHIEKIDPGEKFPWKLLAKKNLGIWHRCETNILRKYRGVKIFKKTDQIKFIQDLKKIGYCFSSTNKFFYRKTIKAFQRHHRKELVNGVADKECLIISQNLLKYL